jgi:hypothetical protein
MTNQTAHLNKQHKEIVRILNKQGKHGMNSFEYRTLFIQLPARIKELKKMGYLISTRTRPNRSVDYILAGEPEPIRGKKTVAAVEPIKEWVFEGGIARLVTKIEPAKPMQEAFF